MGRTTNESGIDSWQGQEFFLFSTACWAHPTSHKMGVHGCFPGVESDKDVKLITHLHLVLWLTVVKIYLHHPIHVDNFNTCIQHFL
jgi:hypothetical protein